MNEQIPEKKARTFHCSNCNAPLDIPENTKGTVVCPFCETQCVIEGIVKNSEIADKENINSGIPLSSKPKTLHDIVLNIITESSAMPLDLLDKVEIVHEERHCVPAFLFRSNGTTSFSYEAGNVREHKNVYDRGDAIVNEKEEYLEWTQMTGNAYASAAIFVPGNKEYADIIEKLYMVCEPTELIDIEELSYPSDIITHNYTLPQSAAFDDYVKPYMEVLLEKKAEESLSGKRFRNLSAAAGCKIQNDEVKRIYLGVYKIIYKYKNKEYFVYVSGDGERYVYDEVPIDSERQSKIDSYLKDIKDVPDGTIIPIIGIVVSAILAFVFYSTDHTFFTILGIIAAIVSAVFFFIKKSERDDASAKIQQQLDAYAEQATSIQEAFKQSNKKLHGIYQKVE